MDASLLTSSAEESAQIEAYQKFGLRAVLFSCNDNNYSVVTTYKDFINTPSWNPEKGRKRAAVNSQSVGNCANDFESLSPESEQ